MRRSRPDSTYRGLHILISSLLLALILTLLVGVSAHFYATRRMKEFIVLELQSRGASNVALGRVRLGLSGITLERIEATIHEQKFSIDSLQGNWKAGELWSYLHESFEKGRFQPSFPLNAITLRKGTAKTGGEGFSSFLGELSGVWQKPLEEKSTFIGELTTSLLYLPELEVTVRELGKEVTLHAKMGEFRIGEERVPIELFKGVIRDRDGSRTELQASFQTPHFGEFTLRGALFRKQSNGKIELLTMELPLKELQHLFSRMSFYKNSPHLLPLNLEDGTLKWRTSLSWGDSYKEEHEATLERVRGSYGSIGFQNLSLPLRSIREKDFTYKILPMEISADSVQAGITASNLRLKSNGEISPLEGKWKMYFGDIQFSSLDAPFRVGAFTLRETPQNLLLPITTEEIALEKLLSLIPNNPVKATGAVSLYLPLELGKDGKVSLKEGKATAIPPGGTIQYERASPGGAASYDFTARALRNYAYSKLVGTINLVPDGTLTLQMAMSGKNIQLNKTRPIDVNVNVEQNLWKFLESLQAVDRVGERVNQAKSKKGT